MKKLIDFIEGMIDSHPVISTYAALTLVVPTFVYIGASCQIKEYRENLIKDVEYLADQKGDKNGKTSSEEWQKTYKELGLIYDERTSNPLQDLTDQDARFYLSKNNFIK